MDSYQSFVNPAPMYRGTDFWMLNDRLEEGELIRQLHAMKEQGYLLGVATATPRHIAVHALEHLGMLPLMDAFISTKDIGIEKTEPDVYLECARRLGAQPQDIAVYEDAIYAVRTAHAAGFHVVAVNDGPLNAACWDEMIALADEVIVDWTNA